MMNKFTRILALCAALMLALSCCAVSLAESIDDTAVLVTYDGDGITVAEVKDALANLIANSYVTDETDYATAIDYLLQDRVLQDKIAELGLNEFSAEEEEALKADAESQWQQAIDTYVSYFLTEDTDEARTQARQDAEAYYGSYGYNLEALFESLKNSAAYDKLEEKILEGKDYKPTEDAIRAVFEEYAPWIRSSTKATCTCMKCIRPTTARNPGTSPKATGALFTFCFPWMKSCSPRIRTPRPRMKTA
jgi:predicted nucleic acid-binding protein